MIRLLVIVFTLLPLAEARAGNTLDGALGEAIAAFEKAAPRLGESPFGVDLGAYRDGLVLGRFHSHYWGGSIAVDWVTGRSGDVDCKSYAAFVRLPPRDGRIALAICPVFSTPGTEALRRLTVLHEMVHVVAGPDECRAMAFAARVEQLAFGAYTPVERYWRANDCAGSGFSLP